MQNCAESTKLEEERAERRVEVHNIQRREVSFPPEIRDKLISGTFEILSEIAVHNKYMRNGGKREGGEGGEITSSF